MTWALLLVNLWPISHFISVTCSKETFLSALKTQFTSCIWPTAETNRLCLSYKQITITITIVTQKIMWCIVWCILGSFNNSLFIVPSNVPFLTISKPKVAILSYKILSHFHHCLGRGWQVRFKTDHSHTSSGIIQDSRSCALSSIPSNVCDIPWPNVEDYLY